MKYRKKPLIVDAIQFDGYNHDELSVFSEGSCRSCKPWKSDYSYIEVKTLEGTMEGTIGHWLVRGIEGEFYFCHPDIFNKTYERVEE